MNTDSHRNLAGYISLLAAAIISVLLSTYSFWVVGKVEWFSVLLAFAISWVLIFMVANFLIKKFIYNKIKLIYKIIHKNKVIKGNEEINISTGILSQVQGDVEKWAGENAQERQKLQIKEAFSREFIGNVAHELKTPIFNIQGYILTLLEGGLEDAKINRKYLLRAEKSVDRMINLVEDLDVITRIESKKMSLTTEKTDMVELSKEVIEFLENQATEKGISIKFNKTYDTPVWVKCDRKRISQVLVNLLVNSIKYSKEGGTTTIRFFDIDENILVEIADNGIGINEVHLPRLFERFYRVEESRSRDSGGSGLGLAIVKHIIDAHQQTINVRSTEGVGSTFSFTLKKTNNRD